MVGIDTVQISRIKKAVGNPAFKNRVFTPDEIAYCESKADPVKSYAGIFCAKEAAAKALGTGFGCGIMPTDIAVVHDKNGAPRLEMHGNAAASLAERQAHVSISHDGDYAVAAVFVCDKQ